MIAALTTSTLALLLSGMVLVLVLRLPAVLGPAWIGGPAMIRCRQGVGRQAGRQAALALLFSAGGSFECRAACTQ